VSSGASSRAVAFKRGGSIGQSVGIVVASIQQTPLVLTGFLERSASIWALGYPFFHPGNNTFSINPGVKFETAKVAFMIACSEILEQRNHVVAEVSVQEFVGVRPANAEYLARAAAFSSG
jgi:hypothetical protein